MIVPIKIAIKSVPVVGIVPAVTGSFFFVARLPAMARTGTITPKRPRKIAAPHIRL